MNPRLTLCNLGSTFLLVRLSKDSRLIKIPFYFLFTSSSISHLLRRCFLSFYYLFLFSLSTYPEILIRDNLYPSQISDSLLLCSAGAFRWVQAASIRPEHNLLSAAARVRRCGRLWYPSSRSTSTLSDLPCTVTPTRLW